MSPQVCGMTFSSHGPSVCLNSGPPLRGFAIALLAEEIFPHHQLP